MLMRRENGRRERLKSAQGNWDHLLDDLPPAPYWTNLLYKAGDTDLGVVRASSVVSGEGHAELSARLNCGDEALSDAEYCTWIVESLRETVNALNPSFGRVEYRDFDLITQVDRQLNRHHDDSIHQAREFLRGYAWVTICPRELVARLGGAQRLEETEAFHCVLPLDGGAVLLQASETPMDFGRTERRRIFPVLAPVLPPGAAQPPPAHPPNLKAALGDALSRLNYR
ncbi:type VI immunity family protein [Streptomyces jumonjinensis]|uniref:DUF3396 domain-containing protein n=1 Tax=Streptomyces jumonjinensis TaxID=1945 RepID=A0A646KQG0_STRJU|nr:DUF3396 domain-containing protein [Streptomyces jumonjinensis]MQT04121.1 DUF3396 domain-containing protein [Streptomyces jumonjinensis]